MDVANVIKDKEGIIPFISVAAPDWTGWLGLNTEASLIPVDAEFFATYNMLHRDEDQEAITSTGRFVDIDWATDPDWFRAKEGWRGFIPIKDAEDDLPCPPFLDFDRSFPHTRVQDSYVPSRGHAKSIFERFRYLDGLVFETSLIDFHSGNLLQPPAEFNASDFESTWFDSVEDLQRAAAKIRRAIADRMGWLYWVMAFIPRAVLEAKTPSDLLSKLTRATGIKYKSRGFILRLADCWTGVNIPFWLSNEVPIFYCWRFEERALPNLIRMHPKLIAGDTSDGRVALHYIEEDDELRQATRNTYDYDDYFQQIQPPSNPWGHLSFELTATLYVIDFQGWGRRPLPEGINPRVYATRFQFRIYPSTDQEEDPDVVFWRWKKKLANPYTRLEDGILAKGDADESFLRELLRNDYAPSADVTYDEETGLELVVGPEVGEGTKGGIVVFNDGDIGSLDPPRSPSPQPDPGQMETPVSPRESPSLFERLGLDRPTREAPPTSYVSVASITNWRNSGRRLEEENRGSEGQVGSLQRRLASPRSRSPRRLLLPNVQPARRPLALFRESLRDIGRYITVSSTVFPLSVTHRWNPTLIDKGVLMIPNPRSEARLRYFANCVARDVGNVSTLLTLAVERRLAFRIAVRRTDIPYFIPRALSLAERMRGNNLYNANFVEAPLVAYEPSIFSTIYIARVTELLSRPHASAFIGMGGPYSWLAQCWGGEELVERFMNGPSTQTTVFNRGASDISLPKPQGLVWDKVSGADMNLLFGYVPANKDDPRGCPRWLYPPIHVLEEACDNWTGEWNWVMEKIFKFLTDKILEVPCEVQPRSSGGWKDWLRIYNRGEYRPEYTLTQRHVDDIFNGLSLARLPKSWNQRPLSTIYIPEEED